MARRQAVHISRRQMHLGSAAGHGEREAARQPAQILVPQPRPGHDQGRVRGHLPPEAAAAGLAGAVGGRVVAGLSLPCAAARHAHQSDRDRPVQFAEFRPNEVVRTVRNPDYWKPGRPYLDGIEWQIMPDISTRTLAFIAGKHDIASPYGQTVPLLNDVKSQAPQAICELTSTNVSRNLIVNPSKPPFDNPDLRRAMALTLDRKAFIDIIQQGKGDIGATMLPPPEGLWGMPPEMLQKLPGYDPDIGKNRAEARKIMEKLGYGPNNRLAVTVSSRNIPTYRQPAVILIDQLKEIYMDGVLE